MRAFECVCRVSVFEYRTLYVHNWADMEQENFNSMNRKNDDQTRSERERGFKKKIDLANL